MMHTVPTRSHMHTHTTYHTHILFCSHTRARTVTNMYTHTLLRYVYIYATNLELMRKLRPKGGF